LSAESVQISFSKVASFADKRGIEFVFNELYQLSDNVQSELQISTKLSAEIGRKYIPVLASKSSAILAKKSY
jgi:hypothetical protein